MNKLFSLLCVVIFYGCISNPTEKHQKARDENIKVHDRIKDIELDKFLFNGNCAIYIVHDYFLICDHKSADNQIYLFDKNNFDFVASTAPVGQGPGEITNIGFIAPDDVCRRIYVNDHGKQKIFSYDLDSVLNDPSYMPRVRMTMKEREFPDWYQIVNDTLQPLRTYQFGQNYYFMAGDQVSDSADSRYWGLLPEPFIVGKVGFISESYDPKTGQIRWGRWLFFVLFHTFDLNHRYKDSNYVV